MISRETVLTGRYETRPLGELVQFLDSQRRPVTAKDRIADPYPYFGANGQQGTMADYLFDEPLVLLAEDGGHFDEPDRGIAYRVDGKTWANNHAHVLRATSQVDFGFLTRALECYDVRPFETGTTRGKLTKAGASRIEIPVPPMDEQRRIAGRCRPASWLRAVAAAARMRPGRHPGACLVPHPQRRVRLCRQARRARRPARPRPRPSPARRLIRGRPVPAGARRSELCTDSRAGALGLYQRVCMEVTSTWRHLAITV